MSPPAHATTCDAYSRRNRFCPDEAIPVVESDRFTGAYETKDRGQLAPPRL